MLHYSRLKKRQNGWPTFSLISDDGQSVEAFDRFVNHLIIQGVSHETLKRYCDVAANFIDYLTEAGVFGKAAPLSRINRAVESYIPIRLRADEYRSKAEEHIDDEHDQWATNLVLHLRIRRLAPSSLSNTLAAINEFLRLAELTHRLDVEKAQHDGVHINESDAPMELFKALQGVDVMTHYQKNAMMRNSMLASVMRLYPNGLKRPKALTSRYTEKKVAYDDNDFPMDYQKPLLDAATSWRDRALWALMAGAGPRTSEAAQVRWDDIDIENRKVYIEDPEHLRFSDQLSKKERLKFKGRAVSATYIIPFFSDEFFYALEQYMKQEWTPGVEHDFVFQDIRKGQNGRPYYELSDQAQVSAFNKACDKISVPRRRGGRRYGKHSLRHFYGVFMLNYIPIEGGGYGLQLGEVQKLMGHTNINTTAQYARQDKLILESKLQFADQRLFESVDLGSLPKMIADRYEAEAQTIKEKL